MTATYWTDDTTTLLLGDTLDTLRGMPDASVDCIVTSPPYYGLRDYGVAGQYGLEPTVADYVEQMRCVFAEARRVLAADGTMWLNLGDSYSAPPPGHSAAPMRASTLAGQGAAAAARESVRTAGIDRSRCLPHKNLMGVPWRTALALQADGWILRNDIIWHKPNPMPESVRDRVSRAHEHLFLLTRRPRYWFALDAIRRPHRSERARRLAGTGVGGVSRAGKNARIGIGDRTGGTPSSGHVAASHPLGGNPGDVWSIANKPSRHEHLASFPIELPIRCITAGCKPGGVVLDPFSGTATTGAAARALGRRYVGIDINADYHDIAAARFAQGVLPPAGPAHDTTGDAP